MWVSVLASRWSDRAALLRTDADRRIADVVLRLYATCRVVAHCQLWSILYVARSPTLMLVANQNSDNVTAFTVSPETGALTPTGAVSHMKWPVSILPLPRPS